MLDAIRGFVVYVPNYLLMAEGELATWICHFMEILEAFQFGELCQELLSNQILGIPVLRS